MDSALVVLDERSSYGDGRLNRFDCNSAGFDVELEWFEFPFRKLHQFIKFLGTF